MLDTIIWNFYLFCLNTTKVCITACQTKMSKVFIDKWVKMYNDDYTIAEAKLKMKPGTHNLVSRWIDLLIQSFAELSFVLHFV